MSDQDQNATEPLESVVSMSEAARALDVSYATMLRWMKKGYIGYLRSPSGRKRIPEREIARIRAEMTHEATNHG